MSTQRDGFGPLPEPLPWPDGNYTEEDVVEYALQEVARAVAEERERCAAMLDAEHEKRKHIDNHAAFYARMLREQK